MTGWQLGGAACLPHVIEPTWHSLVCGGSPLSCRRLRCSSACKGPFRSHWLQLFAVRCSSGCMAPSRGSARTAGHGEPSSHASQVTSKAGGCGSGAHSVPCRGGWVPAFLPLLAPPQRLEALADNPTSTPSVRPCALVQAGTRYARRGALGGTPGRPQGSNPQPHQPGGSSRSRPAYRSPLPIESHQLEEAGSLPTHRGYLHPDRGCDCWGSPGCSPQQPGCLPWRGASTPSRCLLASLSQWRDAGHNLWSAPAKLLSSWGGHPKIAQG